MAALCQHHPIEFFNGVIIVKGRWMWGDDMLHDLGGVGNGHCAVPQKVLGTVSAANGELSPRLSYKP